MKTAVVVMNLGTPTAPEKRSVRAFLREFLSDPRVVEVPRPIWWLILNLFVIPLRVAGVTHAYQGIWTESGSPLRAITESQVKKLAQRLEQRLGKAAPYVCHAMTYSGPDLDSVITRLENSGFERMIILPLYPQYSATTTGCVYDRVAKITARRRNIPEILVIKQYYQKASYIEALAESVRDHWQSSGRSERLLMSFHSVPKKYCDKGDPYFLQCEHTASALAEALQLQPGQWSMSFQSKVGSGEWLSPYTIDVVKRWGEEKLASVDVICPAFSVDCLETLEEIAVENRQVFLDAGGGRFAMIPCLNDRATHIELLAEIIEQYLPK